jgi:cytochrome c oxidase subunit 7c
VDFTFTCQDNWSKLRFAVASRSMTSGFRIVDSLTPQPSTTIRHPQDCKGTSSSVPQTDTYVLTLQMNAQAAVRARMASQQLARRGFHSSRAQFSSPFHYPEGPRNNLPFNTQTRFFALRYWGFMGTSCAERMVSGDALTPSRYRFLRSLLAGS